jgi:polygalacturonase
MRLLAACAVAWLAGVALASTPATHDRGRSDAVPFEMIFPDAPVFPPHQVHIADHGATGDGRTPATAAFAKAIAACAAAGGGRVVVPAGRWLTGAIHLKTNVNLHLEAGATIVFSEDPADYLPAVWVRWAGFECMNYSPLVYARDAENIAITGRGTLDGRGAGWWHWARRQTATATRLYKMTVDEVPVAQRVFATPDDGLRPDFVQWMNCRNVLIEGVTFLSGPFWTVHPTYCDGVILRGVTIRTAGPNTDGIDVDSCRNVLIEDCELITGDDCIVLKSGLNEEGRRIGRPTENVVIRRCTLRNGHGGVTIGSEMSGGVRNVLVQDCDFIGTNIGVRFKSARGRGGVVENIWMRDLRMTNIAGAAISLTTSYRAWFGSEQGLAPVFRHISFERVDIHGAVAAVAIDGLPEQPIASIAFRHLQAVARREMRITDARAITFEDITVATWEAPEVLAVTNTRGLEITRLTPAAGPEVAVSARGTSADIRLIDCDLSQIGAPFRLERGVDAATVQISPATR